MELSQTAWREYHKLLGFVRFAELYNGVLYATVKPRHQVLALLAPHFADRLRHENWMIHDVGRRQVVMHQKDRGWVLVDDSGLDLEKISQVSEREHYYAELWKCFHESIAIEARRSYKLQRQMLPLRYRPYMTEFTGVGH